MKNFEKYERSYFMPPEISYDWVKKDYIDKAPIWCSVDLRDGNQALIEPMSLEEKIEFFQMLLAIGFKEIEVGFPAASETEYQFLRTLIEQNMIPDDVTIQVLTQAREHIIKKTFEAVKGAPHAVIHLYNSTSVAQREQVFKKSKEEVKQIAIDGAKLLKKLADETEGNFTFQYSPESFPGTEVDYALEGRSPHYRAGKFLSALHQAGLLRLPDPHRYAAPEAGTYRRYAGDFVHHCLQAAGDQGRDREDPRGKKRPRSEQAGGI